MTEKHLDNSFPGKSNKFPDGTTHLVYAIYGAQSKDPARAKKHANTLRDFLHAPGGAQRLERGSYVDAQGYHTELLMAYWLEEAPYREFARDSDFDNWWSRQLAETDEDVGLFKEVILTHKDYFNYFAGTEDRTGSVALLELQDCSNYGFWGSYRARIPASEHDKFLPELDTMPEERNDETLNRHLRVSLPDNLCFIREGQGLANCSETELQIWQEQMAGKVDRWIDYLGADPKKTGCISIRYCQESDIDSGERNARQSQNAFLLSLSHIERAARTVCEHLEVRDTAIDMYTEPEFIPAMHLWVEVHIIKRGNYEMEYINCHNRTGFLRFFEGERIAEKG